MNNNHPKIAKIFANNNTILFKEDELMKYEQDFKTNSLYLKVFNNKLNSFSKLMTNQSEVILALKNQIQSKHHSTPVFKNILNPVVKNNNIPVNNNKNVKLMDIKDYLEDNLKLEKSDMAIEVSQYLKLTSFNKFILELATSPQQNLIYHFNNKHKKLIKNLSSILENSFYSMSSLISRPWLEITPNKIIIHLFYYFNSSTNKDVQFSIENHEQLNFLCSNLSKYLKKPVELELVRLHYPFYDSHILANLIGILSNKLKVPFRVIIDRLFNRAKIINPTKMIHRNRLSMVPSFLTGIKVRLGGRLLTQKVVPRLTVKTIQKGSLARCKANVVTSSRFTSKNKRGTFSITVSIGHGFF